MPAFWVGIPGDMTSEQEDALAAAGLAVDDLRLMAAGYGSSWTTLFTYLRVSGEDHADATRQVAAVVGLEPAELRAYSVETFA